MTANKALDRTAMSAVSGVLADARPAAALMAVGQLGRYPSFAVSPEMSKPTKILFALALALLVLSFPTCRWGENTVRYEMTKYPADFVAAHEFDLIFIRWVLPGIAMFFLGGFLAIVAIVFWIVERSNAKRKTRLAP